MRCNTSQRVGSKFRNYLVVFASLFAKPQQYREIMEICKEKGTLREVLSKF